MSHSPYILGDTTRPRRITCVLVWSKSVQRRLTKTLHKQTDRHYENNGHLAVNQHFYIMEISTVQGAATAVCGWEGNRRSGITLAMPLYQRLCCISTYGLSGLRKGDGHPQLQSCRNMGAVYVPRDSRGQGTPRSQSGWRLQVATSRHVVIY